MRDEEEPGARIVVLRALGLGDLLTAVPALRGLRAACPTARIALAAPAALRPLALHVGAVDEVADTAPLAPLPPDLHGADLAVNLHGRGPQSTALLLDSSPRRLLSYGLEGGPVWRADEHEVHRWCRLLAAHGIACDPADLGLAPPPVPPPVAGAVVVHPGAAQASRRWPVDRWVAVTRELAQAGHHVVLSGGPDESELAAAVAASAGLPADRVLAGRTDLLTLAALIASARLLVSADTGVAHLATAYGTPSVVLFGPTPPTLWGPPPDRPQHRALWAGRTGDNFAPAPDPGLLELTVADVLQAAGQAFG
ncbi:MAG: glycosyltransferase family 9 protein [Frankiaceae bacterium]